MALGQLKIEKTFMSSKRIAASSIQADQKIYFVGGYEYSDLIATDKIDVYNTANKTWEKPLKLPSPRAYVSPVKSGSTIYFAGGFTQENCTKLYSPETHNYEWTTGCGSTVLSAKQLSVHNDILTVLGNFSADFYDMKNNNWTHSEELTSWMQRVSMGVLFVHEDIIVGIGGLNHSTLDPYSGAWVFNSTTKKLSTFNDVTTLSKTNLDFNFTLTSDTISVWLEDRYLLHRIGSSEWLEVMDNDIIYVATLDHETFIVKSSGFGVYDWNNHASNMTVDSRQIYNVFTVSNQIVLCKNDSLAIYDGTWTYVPMDLPIQRAAPSFGQYILYDGVLFFYYNPATKTVTALTGGFLQIGSIVAIDSTTFTAFTSSGAYRVLFENGIATRYGVEYPAMDGQFAIGRDVIDPKSGNVWANVTDTISLKSKPLTWSRDGTAITVQPIKTQYTMIDIYDYVTGEWKEPVQLNFTMTKVTFLQAFMIQNTLGLTCPGGKNYYFFNMTSGDTWFLQKFGSFPNGNYATFSQVPVYNNVGYFMVDARTLMEITAESLNLINNQVSAVSYLLHQTYNDNTRAVYMSAYSTDPATFGTFYRILSYDYTSSSWNLFLLPQSQTRLFYAVAQEVLLTFGGDGLAYTYVPLQGAEWHNITYDMQYDPSIITTLGKSQN